MRKQPPRATSRVCRSLQQGRGRRPPTAPWSGCRVSERLSQGGASSPQGQTGGMLPRLPSSGCQGADSWARRPVTALALVLRPRGHRGAPPPGLPQAVCCLTGTLGRLSPVAASGCAAGGLASPTTWAPSRWEPGGLGHEGCTPDAGRGVLCLWDSLLRAAHTTFWGLGGP